MPLLRLTLLRHAKSDWHSPAQNDFDRPLNTRGERDAPKMGRRLRVRGLQPQLVLSSPASRAIMTARIVAGELGYEQAAIETAEDLYLASPVTILKVLCERAANVTNVMLVGHNPGLTDFANEIADIRLDNLPTCGALAVELEANSWADFTDRAGRLIWFDYPKNPAAQD